MSIPEVQLTIQQAFDLAVQRHQAGRLQEAEQLYRQILQQQPQHFEAMHLLGVIAHQMGQNDIAVNLIQRSLALRPDFPEACCNLGCALHDMRRLDEAIAAYHRALALNFNLPLAHSNLGNALREKGQIDEAIAAYHQAIALKPDYAEAHSNLGRALSDGGQIEEALAAYHRAIALNPNLAEAHHNLGNLLKDLGQLDEAIAAYRTAITLRPTFTEAHGNLVYVLHFHPGYDAPAIAAELRRWNRQHAEPLRKFISSHPNDRTPDRRLRIGYVSPDFREHVVGRSLLPLFLQHDRGQFEITCYSNVRQSDAVTSQFRENADCWRDIAGVSDAQAARQIREDRIDILVDLALHSADNRLLVFARKPAPVQVTYLGYCGSTGLSVMDYRLSDPYLDPPDADLSHYSEKTVRLPRSYWCYQPGGATPVPSPSPALQNGFVTFGCLNNFAKVSSAAIDLWARILAELPDARMVIHSRAGAHLNRAVRRFEELGINRDRLRFAGWQPWTDYLATYSQIDIALDPLPHGGGITTCDALWMGVPVVSLSGQTAAGRGGRSILCNLGLPELVAFTSEQYLQIAVDLARDVERLDHLRRGIRARMLASPLMDAPQFARDVEAAYRQMWRRWCVVQ